MYSPLALSIDSQGNVYVCDSGNHRIQKFSASGTYLTKWGTFGHGPGQFWAVTGIAIDDSNHVIVADAYNHNIQIFTTDGAFLRSFLVPWEGSFLVPRRVVVGHDNTLYITSNHHVARISYAGEVLAIWGGLGAGPGQFNLAIGVAVDRSQNVYVVDYYNSRVQLFTAWGAFITTWGASGHEPGMLSNPYGIALDPAGSIYVTDDERVQKFDAWRNFATLWGVPGNGPGQFEEAFDVAVNGDGAVYVLDDVNATVQQFLDSATPTKSTSWGRLKALYR